MSLTGIKREVKKVEYKKWKMGVFRLKHFLRFLAAKSLTKIISLPSQHNVKTEQLLDLPVTRDQNKNFSKSKKKKKKKYFFFNKLKKKL